MSAAAFGRLCVETANEIEWQFEQGAAAFGRLCVETVTNRDFFAFSIRSRLRAAVC